MKAVPEEATVPRDQAPSLGEKGALLPRGHPPAGRNITLAVIADVSVHHGPAERGHARLQRAGPHVGFNVKFLRVLYESQKAPLWLLK